MKAKQYLVSKSEYDGSLIYINDSLDGFKVKPKKSLKYDGIKVNTVVVINQSMIEKVLKRKIKNKLDLYLKLITDFIDSDDDDSSVYREALNDLTRYKSIVMGKYQKYLDEKYLKLLMKKIAILEFELNKKISVLTDFYENVEEKEEEIHRRR